MMDTVRFQASGRALVFLCLFLAVVALALCAGCVSLENPLAGGTQINQDVSVTVGATPTPTPTPLPSPAVVG